MEVLTRYARSADRQITYQVAGEGPLDVVVVPRFFSNIEMDWELPPSARFLGQLASFARLIQFDRRGAGMSGGVAGATPLEEQVDDVRAVMPAQAPIWLRKHCGRSRRARKHAASPDRP
jgi:pimeloyl-ACP methyl ester carboxylesterase